MSFPIINTVRNAGRLFKKSGMPLSLVFFVTSRCNLLCTHCFYWKEINQQKNELTLEEIKRIARSLPNLLSVSLTGGEPYLRPDLPEIAELFQEHSHVRNIQIPSNGLLVDKIVSQAETLLRKVRKARVATGVSLDGPEEVHNSIRRHPKSFENAVETLRQLKKLRSAFPNLSVGIALTVSSANSSSIQEFLDYVERVLQPDAISITLVRGEPIDGSLKKVDLGLYRELCRKVIEYRRSHNRFDVWSDRLVIAKEEETYRLIADAATASSRISPCYAGDLIGILSETGHVYLCEMISESMGNVRDFDCDFSKLWNSARANQCRLLQKRLQCQCSYECAMSINTLFNPRRALRIVRKSIFQ